MVKSKKEIAKEHELVHEIFEGLNLRMMDHLLFLMRGNIVVPHHNGESVEELEVVTTHINGNKIGLITDKFDHYVSEKDGERD